MYTRFFDFTQPPRPEDRLGRYITGDEAILIGAPVVVDDTVDVNAEGRFTLKLATGAQAPRKTRSGILVWESVYEGLHGVDPVLTSYDSIRDAPAATPVQLVSGDYVRFSLRNQSEYTFPRNAYPSRTTYGDVVIVAGLGATPTLESGDFLTPGVGTDDDGYWAETSDEDLAWAIVTAPVDATNGVVHAQLLF